MTLQYHFKFCSMLLYLKFLLLKTTDYSHKQFASVLIIVVLAYELLSLKWCRSSVEDKAFPGVCSSVLPHLLLWGSQSLISWPASSPWFSVPLVSCFIWQWVLGEWNLKWREATVSHNNQLHSDYQTICERSHMIKVYNDKCKLHVSDKSHGGYTRGKNIFFPCRYINKYQHPGVMKNLMETCYYLLHLARAQSHNPKTILFLKRLRS